MGRQEVISPQRRSESSLGEREHERRRRELGTTRAEYSFSQREEQGRGSHVCELLAARPYDVGLLLRK